MSRENVRVRRTRTPQQPGDLVPALLGGMFLRSITWWLGTGRQIPAREIATRPDGRQRGGGRLLRLPPHETTASPVSQVSAGMCREGQAGPGSPERSRQPRPISRTSAGSTIR
ncbi:hypothetical protein HD597_002572 [Nonomuraea thailandensis]|uniref:Uncharacterized protein n=1 Tax=Nonomuraea thailandensis TaxID=1188745 RepID=A0A9X2JZR2_9ACTN|nr:hypothetical protein [Nonomuraea thailandensis]MCP2355552.1 hypothetical protein [Nonomuraea thailandensis]